MKKKDANTDLALEPEENTEEQEPLAVWFEDQKYSGLLEEE